MVLFPPANVIQFDNYFIIIIYFFDKVKIIFVFSDAHCVSLPDDKDEGLKVLRADEGSVLVPFRENVTLTCGYTGRQLRKTASSGFRQCVYDPKAVNIEIICLSEGRAQN